MFGSSVGVFFTEMLAPIPFAWKIPGKMTDEFGYIFNWIQFNELLPITL
jgi:hypothetical protein